MPWDAEKISKLSTDALTNLCANATRLGEASVVDLCQVEIAKRTPAKKSREVKTASRSSEPVKGFHFVCDNERGVTRNQDGTFWSGTWVVSEKNAENALKSGAYVALHRSRAEPSYLQGTVTGWRKSPRERRYGDQEAQTRFGIDFLLQPTVQAYEWVGDATGEKGYAR